MVYPLTEELWMDWFTDELPLATIPQQQQYLESKFELAVQDYCSVKVCGSAELFVHCVTVILVMILGLSNSLTPFWWGTVKFLFIN